MDPTRRRVAWYLAFQRNPQSSPRSLAPSSQRPVIIYRHIAGAWHTSSTRPHNNSAIYHNAALRTSNYNRPQTKSQTSSLSVSQSSTRPIRMPATSASDTGRSGPVAHHLETPPRKLPKPPGAPPYTHSSSITTASQVPNPPPATAFKMPRRFSKRPPVRPWASVAPPPNDRRPTRPEPPVDMIGQEDALQINNPRRQGGLRGIDKPWQADAAGSKQRALSAMDRQAPSDENSEHTQNVGATLHLDGAALGRWTIQHIERALAKPSNGMTGIDPRATPPRGHVSPF
jgi:hypothetical protein